MPLCGQLRLLRTDFHLLQPGQVAQLQLQNRLSLPLGELKGLHQYRFGRFFLADNADYLIDMQKGEQQTLKNMQAIPYLIQTVLQTAANRQDAKVQPFIEQFIQGLDLRATIQSDHIQINPIAALQIRTGKQMAHHRRHIHPTTFELNHQTDGGFMI